jgi:1-acyl-sn-glycerol-3-phosphate acyltransferase
MRGLLERVYGMYAIAVISATLLLITAPVILLLPTQPLRRHAGRLGVRLALALALVPFRVRGLEHLPDGACLVVANHASYLDGPILTAALPQRFTFIVQDGAENWPWVGRVIRRMGVSFVNRSSPRQGARQMRGLIRRLQAGEPLAAFPEGTFRREPGLLSFRNGVFMVAAHASAPVVPAVIRGTRRLFGDGQILPRPSVVDVEFFAPVTAGGDHREEIARLHATTRTVMLQHCGEPDAGTVEADASAVA